MPEVIDRKTNTVPPRARWVQNLLQRRFLVLFLFLLASLALYPFAENNRSGYVAFRFVGSAIIVLSVYAISFRRSIVILGLVLAVPRLIQHYLEFRADAGAIAALSVCLSFAFDVFIVVIMLRRVYLTDRPTNETIFGALSIYILIAYTFASVYGMVETLLPHSFYLDPATNTHSIPNRFDFVYYSFGSMTSLGAAGMIAVSNQARSLTVIQSMLGIFYLAVLIARLMAAYRARAVKEEEREIEEDLELKKQV